MKRLQRIVFVMAFAVVACGDPETTDNRGYTKAPLENPTVLIRGEEPGDMAQYGSPNRVVADVIELPAADTSATAGTPAKTANVELPAGVTQDMVAAGQQTFGTSTCFTCHGMNGTGGPLAPALNDAQWLHIDGSFDAIAQIIADGVLQPKQYPAAMPAKGGAPLTDDQVRELAAYVYSISR